METRPALQRRAALHVMATRSHGRFRRAPGGLPVLPPPIPASPWGTAPCTHGSSSRSRCRRRRASARGCGESSGPGQRLPHPTPGCLLGRGWGLSPPEAPGARPHSGGAAPPILIRDALGAAKVLGQEVQLVQGGLVGQLVQALLRRAGGLRERSDLQRRPPAQARAGGALGDHDPRGMYVNLGPRHRGNQRDHPPLPWTIWGHAARKDHENMG